MPTSFAITNPVTQLTLEGGRGELSYTVTNVSDQTVRGRAYLDLDLREGLSPEWFRIEGESTRTFGPRDTASFQVAMDVPAGVEECQPRVSLSVCNVERPQEDFKPGPAVTVKGVFWEEEQAPLPWYRRRPWPLVLILAAVLLLVLLVWFILWLLDPKLEGKSLPAALQRVAEKEWDLGGISWRFDDELYDRLILRSGTVLEADVTDGEATLVIQVFHSYDTVEDLGISRGERLETIEKIKEEVLNMQSEKFPLSHWYATQDPQAMEEAKEAGAPLDTWGEKRQVFYDSP